jgi:hypothetical protein
VREADHGQGALHVLHREVALQHRHVHLAQHLQRMAED